MAGRARCLRRTTRRATARSRALSRSEKRDKVGPRLGSVEVYGSKSVTCWKRPE